MKSSFFPSPNQLFSEIVNSKLPPLVPTPAPAAISPVGFSSILISIIFKLFAEPLDTSDFTDLKMFLDFKLANDLSKLIFVKGSPSSNRISALMTVSFVILFPKILILSTKFFSPS